MIIYGLAASDLPGVLRYVGKTSQPLAKRVGAHVSRALRQPRHTYKEHWIRSVLARGCQIEGVVMALASTDAEAYRVEQHYIALLRSLGFALTNLSDGGPGQLGLRHSDAAKQKVSAAHKGRRRSPEELEKQRLAHLGLTHSAESKRKMSASRLGKTLTADHRRHIGEASRGRVFSDAHRAKIGDANRRRGERQRERARAMAEGNRGRPRSAESRAKQSAAWAARRALADAPTPTKVM